MRRCSNFLSNYSFLILKKNSWVFRKYFSEYDKYDHSKSDNIKELYTVLDTGISNLQKDINNYTA